MPTLFSSKRLVGFWYLLIAILTGFDQAIKYLVEAALPLYSGIEMLPFFNLVHVLNPGASFSFLAGAGGWQRYLFIVLGLSVSGVLMFLLWRGVRSRLETVAYIGITGGALGNVIDRFRIGAVVDYLDFHYVGWHWPAFNLADVFVVTGAGLLLLANRTEKPAPIAEPLLITYRPAHVEQHDEKVHKE